MPIDWQPLIDILQRHERFVLSSHVRPDADAIGSEMGLAGLLKAWGKQVRIINPSETPRHLRFLDPAGSIQKIVQDVSIESVCETDVHLILDTSAWQQLQEVGEALRRSAAVKVVIDHHLSSDDLNAIEFKDVAASATGVLITELIEAAGQRPSVEQGEALFAAIATDTGWFRFPNADARTLRTAAKLIDAGVAPHKLFRELYERSSLARLKLHARVLDRVETSCSGRLAFTVTFQQDFHVTGALPADTEDLVNHCLTIEGVEAAFILVEQPGGSVKASLRSRSEVNVAAIAERFGGGGHRQAAGVMLPGPVAEAQQSLLSVFVDTMKCDANASPSVS